MALPTIKALQRKYERFRRLYYAAYAHMPDCEDVEFDWVDDNKILGRSWLDLEEPLIEFHVILPHFPRLFDMIFLHEMSHFRLGPRVECHVGSRAWRRETMRLASLGAMKEFF